MNRENNRIVFATPNGIRVAIAVVWFGPIGAPLVALTKEVK